MKCGLEKPLKEYYKHKQMGDGHLNKCKECTKWDNKISNGKYERVCEYCSKKFNTTATEIKRGSARCCSRKCWNALLPIILPRKNRHHAWKGNEISLQRWHERVEEERGKPKLCEMCGTTKAKNYDWANISQEYKHDIYDYMRLCRPCHSKYDWETSPNRHRQRQKWSEYNPKTCSYCGFRAKNKRGLATHIGFKHRYEDNSS